MDSLTVRFKSDDPAQLARLRDVLVGIWLTDPDDTLTIAGVDNVRITYVKEN